MLVSDFDFVMIQCIVKGLLIVGRLVVRSAIILVIKQLDSCYAVVLLISGTITGRTGFR